MSNCKCDFCSGTGLVPDESLEGRMKDQFPFTACPACLGKGHYERMTCPDCAGRGEVEYIWAEEEELILDVIECQTCAGNGWVPDTWLNNMNESLPAFAEGDPEFFF